MFKFVTSGIQKLTKKYDKAGKQQTIQACRDVDEEYEKIKSKHDENLAKQREFSAKLEKSRSKSEDFEERIRDALSEMEKMKTRCYAQAEGRHSGA